ncbi:MAG TPA: extracellular solute-binding protein [Xanthobacteraceae bacterium]|nr:extracellular solute-binding protein [Xanthobacteraceae bacterium]
MLVRNIAWLTLALATLLLPNAATAQNADEAILTYQGPDRTAKLIEGAKKEGALTYYSAMIVNQALRPLTAAYQAKYPFVKINYWRADSEEIETKLAAEMRANNPVGDIIEGTGIGELAVRAGLAQPIFSPQIAGIPEKLRDPDHLWVPTRMSYFGIAYNTRLVPPGTQPKTYEDLLDEKWKGKMAWPLLSSIGAALFVTNLRLAWGDDKTMAYLQRLRTQNIVNFGAGNPRVLVDRVIAGEYPIALEIFAHHPLISAGKGAPVAAQLLPPVASSAGTLVIPKGSRHPYAAALLMDFLLSKEGQQILANAEYLPVRRDVEPLAAIAPIVPSHAGVEENFISPQQLNAYTESSAKIVEDLFR